MVTHFYRVDAATTNYSKDYVVFFKGKVLKGVTAIEYIPERNL